MPLQTHQIASRPWCPAPYRGVPDDRPASTGRVVAELVGLGDHGSQVRLRIAESEFGYDVLAEFEAMPADDFDVELEDNKIYIAFEDRRLPGEGLPPPGWLAEGLRQQVAIAFQHPIDAAASHGEFGDRILHLSLRKRACGPSREPSWQAAAGVESEAICAI
jgi:hypothetical protein